MREAIGTAGLFIGREVELVRLASAFHKVTFALLVGLPGVGKTALVARFAESWGGPVLRRRVLASQAAADLLDELGRGAASRHSGPPSDDERVAELARQLDRDGALLVLEDVDRLDGAGRALLVDLVARVARARIIATARSHVFPIGTGPERLQLVLEGLDRGAAAELWSELDLLYGPCDGFEDAWSRSCGNPCCLRRAHAGDRGADRLVADTVAGLVGDDRALAIALAIAELPVVAAAIAKLLPSGGGDAALDRLLGGLVAERVGRDQVAIHGLLRSAICAAATPAELHDGHRQLAAALLGAGPDPAIEVRARVRHLLASGQGASARGLVLGRAADLVRSGASGELLRCLDAVMSDDDVEVRTARARCLVRMLDLRRAFEDLSQLHAQRVAGSDRVLASLAHVAMLTARFDLADRISRAALAGAALDPALRIRHAAVWLFTRTYQGHGETARAWLAEILHGIDDPKGRGLLAFIAAFSFWLEDRDGEAEDAMRTAWVFLEHDASLRGHVLGRMFWVTVLARAGKTEEALRALAVAEATIASFDDPLLEVSLIALRATLFECQGDFAAALSDLAAAERRWSHGGHAMGVHWARRRRGELMLRIGRVRDGHLVLDEGAREAASAGADLIVRQIERARRADPRRGVREPRARPTRPGEIRRDRVLTVLRAIAAGELAVARGHLAALTGDATLDPLELALVELAGAAIARGDDDRRADAMLVHAAELAGRAGADPELLVELDRWLRDAKSHAGAVQPIVIDRKDHEIRVAGAVVTLGSRPTLRRLLYALLDEPGRSTSKAKLAVALWPSKYRPDRHDSALWVNLKRLRDLLHGTGLRVVTDPAGYAAVVEAGYQLVLADEHA